MRPALALRRFRDELCELGTDECRQRSIEDASLPPRVAFLRHDGAARDGIAGRETGLAFLRRRAGGCGVAMERVTIERGTIKPAGLKPSSAAPV